MTEYEFNQLAKQGYNRIPLFIHAFADLDTPLSAYLKLADHPYSYLLESVHGGERFGRYSFIGLPAETRIVVYGDNVIVETNHGVQENVRTRDPLKFIEQFQSRFKVAQVPGLPRFCGGLVGYFGYDTVRYIEPRLAHVYKADSVNTPDILLLLSEELAVVDNVSGKLFLIVYANPSHEQAYAKAQQRLESLRQLLRRPIEEPRFVPMNHVHARSEFGESAFKAAVDKAKQYIYDGDIMQVVLSQRLSQPFYAPPLSLYRALRSINPSPYMFYFNMRSFQIAGASPEILARLEGDTVTVRPIAGTRRRGKSREEDQALAKDLLEDPKECAEHLMLIDLGRNDLGRICETASVTVTEHMQIEYYSHVMHIVSNVEGRLKTGLNAMDVLRAAFPAGTLSGAPKIRAMEIIDELEPIKRGIYGGAVGYLGFNGDMDIAIAIRTAIVQNGLLMVQSGAGIVADSVPQSEWEETQNKALAVLRAAELSLSADFNRP